MLNSISRYRQAHLSVSKQLPDPSQYAILLWVVRMIFAGNLKHGRECFLELLDVVAYHFGNLYLISGCPVLASCAYMLID
jgi:hypothetical protein